MTDERSQHDQPERREEYESPRVEDVPVQDGPAVTAAGKTPQDVAVPGVEWRPGPEQAERTEEYESPRVEDVPAQDGPAVTAAGKTPVQDAEGPEWRPQA